MTFNKAVNYIDDSLNNNPPELIILDVEGPIIKNFSQKTKATIFLDKPRPELFLEVAWWKKRHQNPCYCYDSVLSNLNSLVS